MSEERREILDFEEKCLENLKRFVDENQFNKEVEYCVIDAVKEAIKVHQERLNYLKECYVRLEVAA